MFQLISLILLLDKNNLSEYNVQFRNDDFIILIQIKMLWHDLKQNIQAQKSSYETELKQHCKKRVVQNSYTVM